MSDFLVYLVSSISLTMIVVEAKLWTKPKYWINMAATWLKSPQRSVFVQWIGTLVGLIYYMINCYQCAGFWTGIIVGVHLNPINIPIVYYGLITSISSVVVVYAINIMDRTVKLIGHFATYVHNQTRNEKIEKIREEPS